MSFTLRTVSFNFFRNVHLVHYQLCIKETYAFLYFFTYPPKSEGFQPIEVAPIENSIAFLFEQSIKRLVLLWIQRLVKKVDLPQGYPLLATEKTKQTEYPYREKQF